MKIILTCEHGGNFIPASLNYLFKDEIKSVNSHRGIDLGAEDLFRDLKPLADYSLSGNICRLVIELNRSMKSRNLFSDITAPLSVAEKESLIKKYYIPFRREVIKEVENSVKSGREVLHISIHSFTPYYNENIRNADIGLLYDPSRNSEKKFTVLLKQILHSEASDLKVRMNYPYRGISDGHTRSLRKQFPERYAGIEIEINQKWSRNNLMNKKIKKSLSISLRKAIEQITLQP